MNEPQRRQAEEEKDSVSDGESCIHRCLPKLLCAGKGDTDKAVGGTATSTGGVQVPRRWPVGWRYTLHVLHRWRTNRGQVVLRKRRMVSITSVVQTPMQKGRICLDYNGSWSRSRRGTSRRTSTSVRLESTRNRWTQVQATPCTGQVTVTLRSTERRKRRCPDQNAEAEIGEKRRLKLKERSGTGGRWGACCR